ncbi:MAG: hypothetical protein PF447_02755 [Spirochaetaceae bacterium]|nr:hypothetical protein [Spirochaetaceae bacterium]
MKKYIWITYIIIFISFSLGAQQANEESIPGDAGMIFSSGIDFARYILKGDSAWDTLQLYSAQTMVTFILPIEESDGNSAVLTFGYRQPFFAKIDQLDGDLYTVETGSSSGFVGFYSFSGILIKRKIYPLDLVLSLGPAADFYYGNDRYLGSLSLEAKGYISVPMNHFLSAGIEIACGYDYWGIHNMGDSTRYSGEIQYGLGLQTNAFIAIRY